MIGARLAAGVALSALMFGSVSLNLWQAGQIGEKNEALRTASERLDAASEALKVSADNLKEYQDGNVLNRQEAARVCRAGALAAYDAGVGSVSGRSVAERAAAGAFVPGQRQGGGDR